MKSQATSSKFFALAGLSFVLTLLTVFLGSPLIRVMHRAYKPVYFWAFGILVSVAFLVAKVPIFAVLFASVWFLIGSYGELEKRGSGWKWASFLSLLGSSVILLGGLTYTFLSLGINTWDRYVLFLTEVFAGLQQFSPSLKLDINSIAQQTPSMLVSLLVTALGNALIFERRSATYLKIPYDKIASQLKLLEFKLPDVLIWIFLSAILFSMVNFGLPILSVIGFNLVNVGVTLFFFQGLAVLEVFFVKAKTSSLMKALTYIILVGYLFVLLSALGLIDYWVDFRSRLRKEPPTANN